MIHKFAGESRHINLARALDTRLFISADGRVYPVGGSPVHEKLAARLQRDHCPLTAVEAATPSEMGIPTCDGELIPERLHAIGQALQRWRKHMRAEIERRPAHRRPDAQLASERREFEKAALRLAAVRRWQAQLREGKEPFGAPYFLDSQCEQELRAELNPHAQDRRLTPLTLWHARLVYWLAGAPAVRRYLSAVTQLLAAYPERSRIGRILGFRQALVTWKHRAHSEPLRGLRGEMAQHIRRLPADAVHEGRLSSRPRGRSFQEHCEQLLARCDYLLKNYEQLRWRAVPAAIAALVATDESTVPLPRRAMQTAARQEDYRELLYIVDQLAKQKDEPGYHALLAAIDQLPENLSVLYFGQIRDLLISGNSLEDLNWIVERNLLHCLLHSRLTIRDARRLSTAFAARGMPLDTDDLSRLFSSIEQTPQLALVETWLRWLGSVSPSSITARLRSALWSAFWRLYLPSARWNDWCAQMAPCVRPARARKSCDDLEPLRERIVVYQQLAGQPTILPKSIRNLSECADRRKQEREHLRACRAAGTLNPAAELRLRSLEASDHVQPAVAKLRRTMEEAFLRLGIDAMASLVKRLAEARCQEHLGDLVRCFAPKHFGDLALWINNMSHAERNRLHEVVAAFHDHGPNYKRFLSANEDWIAKAPANAVDLEPWFDASPQWVSMAGRRVKISVASELQYVFLMGDYFRTCLSLNGCNHFSVLSNAYDANKQVVFMFAEDEGDVHVLARQLVAISSEFKLVAYCCYVNCPRSNKTLRDAMSEAMAQYCGRLAARCGLELADQGSPEDIDDHGWYDDGERPWSMSARKAWTAEDQASRMFAQ